MAKKKSIGKTIVKILLSVILVIAMLAGTVYLVIYDMLSKMEYIDPNSDDFIISSLPEDPDESLTDDPDTDSEIIASYEPIISGDVASRLPVIQTNDKTINVLLIGTDSRTASLRGRTDSMIIVTLNTTKKRIVLTSVMRDSYVHIPKVDTYNRINAAYVYGGESLLIKTMWENLGIKIDKFVTVNFQIFSEFIDDLGGVDIDFDAVEYDAIYPRILSPVVKAGKMTEEEAEEYKNGGIYHANGAEALTYARIRHAAGSDFRRTGRQRKILISAVKSMAEKPLMDVIALMEKYLSEVRTSFTTDELMGYILSFATYMDYDIVSWRIPEDGTWQNLSIGGRSMLGVDFAQNLRRWNEIVYD